MSEAERNTRLLHVATDAARAAGLLIRERIDDPGEISAKPQGAQNLVTEMDVAAERLIKSMIAERMGSCRFLAEESGGDYDLGPLTWVIDPIDGTVNYAHGLPIYCVSIAAVENNRPVVGAIYNPTTDEMFSAVAGDGAAVNGQPLSVSRTTSIDAALLVTGFPYNVAENPYGCLDSFTDFMLMGTPVRRLGSAALDLAYVAAGRFDGFWEVDLNPWDVAAGALMVVEAGGEMTTYGDRPVDSPLIVDRMLATNGRITQAMLEVLSNPGAMRRNS